MVKRKLLAWYVVRVRLLGFVDVRFLLKLLPARLGCFVVYTPFTE
jgi:hypothetical protein